jgi:FixJ family two-component response regulator
MDTVERRYTNVCPDYLFGGATSPVIGANFPGAPLTGTIPLTPGTISIVDDDAWSRRGLGDLIQSLGYTARTFASAEEFVESGSIEETSCVITDLWMPGLSGLQLQSRLRDEGHNIPLIVMTAYPTKNHREQAFAGGATGFLSKPLDEESLVACLAHALKE